MHVEELDSVRERAIYEVKMLKRYYKKSLSSRPRALLYYEIKPEELVEYLQSIDFELPPERGREQIQAAIESVEKQIEAIEIQIDMLNRQRSQVEDWLKRERPELQDHEPPGPDDGDEAPPEPESGPVLRDLSEETDTALKGAPANPPQQDQLEEIESARMRLLNSKDKLEQQVEELKKELTELRDSERERQNRFRTVNGKLNDYIKAFNRTSLNRPDIFMVRASSAVAKLRNRYLRAADPRTQRTFTSQMDELSEAYKALSAENDRHAAAKVGNLLGWLESAGQDTGLTAAIKSRYSKPNLVLSISGRLIDALVSRQEQQAERVNENVLGRLIRGRATANADISLQLLPDPNQFRAALDFKGGIDADTYTRAGKLTAYAGSRVDFNFRRDLFANVGGFFIGAVYGDLQLESWFKCIDSPLRLVQKLALKQYYKSKDASESVSRSRTRKKVVEPFREETDKAIEQAYEGFGNINQQQTAIGRWLPSFYLSTTSNRIFVTGQRGTSYDLAATTSQDAQHDLGSDVEIRIHESMLSNYVCLLYTSPSPRDLSTSRMPSSA